MSSIQRNRKTIPIEVYYFACNLDHVLFEKNNLSDEEKEKLARKFGLKYDGIEIEFIPFIAELLPELNSDYRFSWEFVKHDCHSLERWSNLACLFYQHKSHLADDAQKLL